MKLKSSRCLDYFKRSWACWNCPCMNEFINPLKVILHGVGVLRRYWRPNSTRSSKSGSTRLTQPRERPSRAASNTRGRQWGRLFKWQPSPKKEEPDRERRSHALQTTAPWSLHRSNKPRVSYPQGQSAPSWPTWVYTVYGASDKSLVDGTGSTSGSPLDNAVWVFTEAFSVNHFWHTDEETCMTSHEYLHVPCRNLNVVFHEWTTPNLPKQDVSENEILRGIFHTCDCGVLSIDEFSQITDRVANLCHSQQVLNSVQTTCLNRGPLVIVEHQENSSTSNLNVVLRHFILI